MSPQEIAEKVRPFLAQKCFLKLEEDNYMFPRKTSMPVEVIDWSDEEGTESVRHDVVDIFESYDDFSPKRTVPFGLVSQSAHEGGTDWDAILVMDASSGAVQLFHVAKYRFYDIAESIDDIFETE